MVYLYVHVVPNGKRYIGIAHDLESRWQPGGKGYKDNKDFYRDILFYGWDNIKHEIIDVYEEREEAEKYESLYIVLFNTEQPEMGYNRTNIKEDLLHKYQKRINKSAQNKSKSREKSSTRKQELLRKFNMPWPALSNMIDEWIFSDKARIILKKRIYDGTPLYELAKEFSLSDTAIKNIIKDGIDELERHI